MLDTNEKIRQVVATLAHDRVQKIVPVSKFINNSLDTGETPYDYCFGSDNSCKGNGCSQISVKTPYDSDVLVTIKKNGDAM